MKIDHDIGKKRFVAYDDDACQIGSIRYSGEGPVITADGTYVEEASRGQGVAQALLDAMVEYARANKLKIRPVCEFVVAAFRREPQWYGEVIAE